MNYDVTYSLRRALADSLPELNDVQLIYEGADLTGISKPFATLEYLQDVPELLSAGRRSYYDTFNFQVGIFANNVNERHLVESKVRAVLRKPEGHTLYRFDEPTGTFVDTGTLMQLEDNGFTPIGNNDNSAETFSHHGYFDVAVEIIS